MLKKLCLVLILNLILLPLESRELNWNEKLGQSFFLGIYGKKLTRASRHKLNVIKPGGIILFGANISNTKQLQNLIAEIHALYSQWGISRPFIAVDQEGGYVTRVKTSPLLPSPALIGEITNQDHVRELSYFNSKYLRSLGINMNLSPVLDIQSKSGNNFLGSRSFSEELQKVEEHGERVIEGANNAFVVSTAKHFPGHGDVKGDSHKKLPVSNKSEKDLFSKELVPYLPLIETKKLPAVMVGHIAFPKLEEGKIVPASFSPNLIQGLLRKKLGFNGIIITDDIQMEGAGLDKHTGKRAKQSLDAGVDMVMIAWNRKEQIQSFKYLRKVLKTNHDFRKSIAQKFTRIQKVKRMYQLDKDLYTTPQNVLKSKLALENFVHKLFHDLDFDKTNKKYLKHIAYNETSKPPVLVLSKYKSFYKNIAQNAMNKRVLFFQLNRSMNLSKIRSLVKKYKNSPIYFQVSNSRHLALWNQLKKESHNKILLVNSTALYDIKTMWQVNTKTNLPSIGKVFAKRLSQNKKRGLANARASIQKKSNAK